MATPASTETSTGSFDSHLSFAKLYQGLGEQGITLSDAEKAKLEEIFRNRIRQFNPGSLFGGDADGLLMKFVNMFVYFLQSVYRNVAGASAGDFTGWLSQQGQQTANFGEFKALQDSAAYIFMDLKSAGGNLARAATLISGVSADGTTPEKHSWDMYNQLRPFVADPVNPRSVSLNLNTGQGTPEQLANGTAVAPPPGLPRIQSLTRGLG